MSGALLHGRGDDAIAQIRPRSANGVGSAGPARQTWNGLPINGDSG